MRALALILCLTIGFAPVAWAEILKIDYEGFTVWVDCAQRGPVLFHYIAEADSGSLPRESTYVRDPNVSVNCQATNTDTFQSIITNPELNYDVGHQVPANHFDGSELAIHQTNFWTNLLPQTLSMNRGAWRKTEDIIECIRDEVPLEVWGGPIWGSNFEDDLFVESHGVQTPSAFWKVVIRTDNREAIAWIIPNGEAPRSSIDQWLESIETIEKITGREFDAADKTSIPAQSWQRPTGCDIE